MSRKSTIDALFGTHGPLSKPVPAQPVPEGLLGAPNNPAPETKSAGNKGMRTGAVAAIGATLQQWGNAAKTVADLQAQAASAQTLLELDPGLIDPAPLRDRLPLEDDATFVALKQSIQASGQQVPILVRPHPDMPGRYQTAYGHRRLRACAELGVRVRAVVAALSEDALVIAQGQENRERRDLSFIETALFARRLEERGCSRALIISSLGIDKGDVSRFITVAGAVPEPMIRLIGPAPKTGRARWMALAEALKGPRALERADDATVLPDFSNADSERRFAIVLEAASKKRRPATARPPDKPLLKDRQGRSMAAFQRSGKIARIAFDTLALPDFAEFVAAELPDLYRRFSAGQG